MKQGISYEKNIQKRHIEFMHLNKINDNVNKKN